MAAAVDIDNVAEPAVGDAVPLEIVPHTALVEVPVPSGVTDEALIRALAVCRAHGLNPLTPEEHERFGLLEAAAPGLRRSLARAEADIAALREQLEDDAVPADTVAEYLARAAREMGEAKLRAAFVADGDALLGGRVSPLLPERMRVRR